MRVEKETMKRAVKAIPTLVTWDFTASISAVMAELVKAGWDTREAGIIILQMTENFVGHNE